MAKRLPSRPNLDHLRNQAKSLLHALGAGDAAAIAVFREFLPAAKSKSPAQVRAAGFRLADAQSAIARKSGFAAWPPLARYVEQLRALEGTWSFERLEVDGAPVPPEAMQSSRLLIDGDRFRTESPEADHEGVFNINVEVEPHEIDIEFIAGPEAGNWNHGIFRVEGDRLEICLDMNGKPRPKEFRTTRGSGHACETLLRTSGARPPAVSGGTAPAKVAAAPQSPDGLQYAPSPTLDRLQGEWAPVSLIRDGKELPAMMMSTGYRTFKGHETKVCFGGQVIVHALVRIGEGAPQIPIDYFNLAGAAKGSVQLGIMEWRGDEVCICMAAPGQARPSDFECPSGSGRTVSQWRHKS